jgi:hypothetical protein
MFVNFNGTIYYVRDLGGPGSGNWGHLGIPGYRGGSQAGSGGVHARPENYKEKKGVTDKKETLSLNELPKSQHEIVVKSVHSDLKSIGPSTDFNQNRLESALYRKYQTEPKQITKDKINSILKGVNIGISISKSADADIISESANQYLEESKNSNSLTEMISKLSTYEYLKYEANTKIGRSHVVIKDF